MVLMVEFTYPAAERTRHKPELQTCVWPHSPKQAPLNGHLQSYLIAIKANDNWSKQLSHNSFQSHKIKYPIFLANDHLI